MPSRFQLSMDDVVTLKAAIMLLLLPSLLLGLAALVPAQKPAPPQCIAGSDAPGFGFWSWAKNSRVKVYLRTNDFNAEETASILAPLQNWNSVSVLAGSGVTLEYAGAVEQEKSCQNCLTIMRGPVSGRGKSHAAGNLRAYADSTADHSMANATIVIEPTLTNLEVLTDIVAHELGHSFGLLDCYTCSARSTVMNQFKNLKVPNEMPAPTACDIAQVAAMYSQPLVKKAAAALNRKALPIEEGEEPIDDDTPIVTLRP